MQTLSSGNLGNGLAWVSGCETKGVGLPVKVTSLKEGGCVGLLPTDAGARAEVCKQHLPHSGNQTWEKGRDEETPPSCRGLCCGLNCISPKRQVQIPKRGPCERGLIWKKDLCAHHQGMMKSH